MKLSERMNQLAPAAPGPPPVAASPVVEPDPSRPFAPVVPTAVTVPTPSSPVAIPVPGPAPSTLSARVAGPKAALPGRRPQAPGPAIDALGGLKQRAAAALFDRVGSRFSDSSVSDDELRKIAKEELSAVIDEEQVPLSPEERRRLILEIADEVMGYGPLQRLLEDPSITEIMVNSSEQIYVERKGRLTLTNLRFSSDDHLRQVIERIVSKVGRRIDESSPLVDARLEDGSRVNAIIPPLAVNGPSLTIRKFAQVPITVNDLLKWNSLTPEMAELLDACVKARLNIIVSGGTGTGKTTMLNVVSGFIPDDDRIVTIEDAVELQLQQAHVVRLESRPANIEGKGAVGIRELLKNSLRMRPDRIIVGECRGGEALDMLQAMNTGHDGSLSTVHANSPRDAIARLETLVLMAGMDLPLRAIREQIASAVDLIIQLTRMRDGSRRVTHVTEVQGMEGEIVTLQDAFLFDYSAGMDAQGRFLGRPMATGIRPRFLDRFDELGIHVSPGVFATPQQPMARR
ncbi:pilus assembly protein CpaF [Arthrobacter sp. PL16]|uniref:CpaF family protein n=1 Tax=Arthrobacter sp. PL16 TaxID=3071720 RepID=UPI002E05CB62|nr:pilus assembly protein CpaF [Arthrobacter sp. PL16]